MAAPGAVTNNPLRESLAGIDSQHSVRYTSIDDSSPRERSPGSARRELRSDDDFKENRIARRVSAPVDFPLLSISFLFKHIIKPWNAEQAFFQIKIAGGQLSFSPTKIEKGKIFGGNYLKPSCSLWLKDARIDLATFSSKLEKEFSKTYFFAWTGKNREYCLLSQVKDYRGRRSYQGVVTLASKVAGSAEYTLSDVSIKQDNKKKMVKWEKGEKPANIMTVFPIKKEVLLACLKNGTISVTNKEVANLINENIVFVERRGPVLSSEIDVSIFTLPEATAEEQAQLQS